MIPQPTQMAGPAMPPQAPPAQISNNTKIGLFTVGGILLGYFYCQYRIKQAKIKTLTPDQVAKDLTDQFNALLDAASTAGDSAAGLRDKWIQAHKNTPAK